MPIPFLSAFLILPRHPHGGPKRVLRELSVQNFALIEDARVELSAGYCAWTGETGAGKSLLLAALGLVTGGKATPAMVRRGKAEARASAVFDLGDASVRADVEAILGGPLEDDELILTRRVAAAGRGSAHADGQPVSASTLRQLGRRLVDIHGQHEGRALLDPDRQRSLLDAHGGLGPVVEAFTRKRDHLDTLRKRRDALRRDADARAQDRDRLAFERDELAAADPRAEEPEALAAQARRLASAEAIRAGAAEGYKLLYEADGSARDRLQQVARSLSALGEVAPELAEAAETLERLAEEAREVAYTLRHVSKLRGDDPGRLDAVEERLATYRRLAARCRCAPEALQARRSEVEALLAVAERDEAELSKLDAPIAAAWGDLRRASTALSDGRRRAASAFLKAVQPRLKALGLAGVRLGVEVVPPGLEDPETPPTPGNDRVEILLGANPGEPARPLRLVASGGELSRVTLAIKAALAGVDGVPTLVFDEVDTGVGGRLGAALGRALADLSKHHQVLCVTHLPQMASHADRHWVVRKEVRRGRTRTTIAPLGEAERVAELAAMIRGDQAAESTHREALAMLAEARALR